MTKSKMPHKMLDAFLDRFRPGRGELCACGRPHEIQTQVVVVKPGAASDIPAALKSAGLADPPPLVAVTFDKHVRPIAEEKALPALKRAGIAFEPVCLEAPGEVQADVETAGELMARIPEETGVLMCVGSGTMSDLSKYSAAVRGLPYVSVASAASMNGYASSITALTAGQFKTTQETQPAMVVIADVDILSKAPVEMTRAGLGDLVSKWVCNADWMLSHLVRKTYFCDVPFGLIREQERYYMSHAAELGRNEPEAVQALAEAIMISGFSMSIVGVSSPSSGSEHLVSHTWEMKDRLENPEGTPRLHGAQVGVATVLMARLYELVAELDPRQIDPHEVAARYPRWDDIEKKVTAYFGPITPDIIGQAREKYPEPRALELEIGRAHV